MRRYVEELARSLMRGGRRLRLYGNRAVQLKPEYGKMVLSSLTDPTTSVIRTTHCI
jgi:hypothetical protein